MYVKRLEMHGFKTFADRTTLELTPGITVVVGPNGCGKSNIGDALRWVLGEQSVRLLRGMRMEDIIFSGAAGRKPLGFAEVSVVLDHSDGRLALDYREVTVTRRLYRDGTSEYLLNRHACRLKEILELFMDTGIGKEAYSFIGQGRIDEILSARPEERRLIFEEAAGIQKYKSRKREAERRLTETAENLLRVGDVIRELSGQLEPLTVQAATGRRYLELREELKNVEIDLLVHEARTLRGRWQEKEALCREAANELLKRQTALAEKEVELAGRQQVLDEEQSALTLLQSEVQRFSAELEKGQGRVALALEKRRGLQQQSAGMSMSLQEMDDRQTALDAEREQVKKTLAEVAAAMGRADEELSGSERALVSLEAAPEVRQAMACRDALESLLTEIRRLQSEHDRLNLGREQLAGHFVRLRQESAQKAAERSALEEKRDDLLATRHSLQQEWGSLVQQRQQKQVVAGEMLARQEILDEQRRQGEKRLAEIDGRLRLLQELESSLAGYGQGVKMVLEAKKRGETGLAGILGTVADVLQVPDRYVTAVEAALGSALLNLVTEDDDDAKKAITFLKKTKGGRATFLPLNLLGGQTYRRSAEKVTQYSGYLGVAAELVDTPERFRKVVETLLSRVHVVCDLEAAVPVARALHFRERVVTLDGDVMLPGGAITGGVEKKQGSILSRRRETTELAQTQAHERRQLAVLAQERQMLADKLAAALDDTKVLEEQSRQQERTISLLERDLTFSGEQLLKLAVALDSLEREMAEMSGKESSKAAAADVTICELAAAHEREKELRFALAGLQGKLDAKELEKRNLREQHTECRIRLAALEKQQEHHEEALGRLFREKTALAAARRRKEEELQRQKALCLELEIEIDENREALGALEKSQTGLLEGLLAKEKAVRLLTTGLRDETERLRLTEKELSAMERRQNRLDLEREKIETEWQSALDRLRENWQLEFAEAERLSRPCDDRAAAISRFGGLKEALQALGMVNLGAIDEHARVGERVEFLTAQREDLCRAEKDLQRIIREIDGRMGEKFATSFASLNESFGQVFKELFGGGSASLCLTDPDNPLESGVEILAQPPGKKRQHLSLLSGGEKALTAIALLFSFFKVKPAPFCLLDEIDTALDETNLAKFSAYLQRLAGKIQFILVSHRKKTMERADMLYGVTMEEAGVSKLISVRLSDSARPEASAG